MPGLSAKPWYEIGELPWAPQIRDNAPEIARELRAVVANGYAQPYGGGWSVYFMWRGGQWVEAHAAGCPVMKQTLSRTPISPGESFISVLESGAQTNIHSGEWNFILTCHVGVTVPEGCEMLVGSKHRPILEGEVMIFDDSFAHSAWNPSDRQRACLVWDVWHPDLTPVEVEALGVLVPLHYRQGTEEHARQYT
jgi:aspartyl/asparaginyl beta-hydroxylase (cupin superfamily)